MTARKEVVGGQSKVELVPVAFKRSGVCGRDKVGGGRAQLREDQTTIGWRPLGSLAETRGQTR